MDGLYSRRLSKQVHEGRNWNITYWPILKDCNGVNLYYITIFYNIIIIILSIIIIIILYSRNCFTKIDYFFIHVFFINFLIIRITHVLCSANKCVTKDNFSVSML